MEPIKLPNKEAVHGFLGRLDPAGIFTYATLDDRGDDPGLVKRFHGPLDDELLAELIVMNNAGAGVFVTVNDTDGAGNHDSNVTRVRAVFVDLDGADVAPVESWVLAPHMVVESSPGRWHAYWLVDGLAPSRFREIQQALAAMFGGDSTVCNPARIMRLPGFFHCKSEPVMTLLKSVAGELPPYKPEQIEAALAVSGRRPAPAAREKDRGLGLVEEGSRNSLTRLAGKLRREGRDEAEILDTLLRVNEARCHPALPEREVERIAKSVARYPTGSATPADQAATDTGNACRFVDRHGSDIKYVPELGKWMVWRGGYWEVDSAGDIVERAKDTARSIFEEAARTESGTTRAMLAKHASQSLNRARLQAMISLAESERSVVARVAQFDADDFLVGVQNGVVNLRNGSFRASKRDDLITQRCGTHFDEHARCPTFLAFLDRVTAGDKELQGYLQRLVGYLLTGSTREQVFAFLYGHGANGKSTFLDVITRLGGDYATQTQPETLMARRGGGASSDLARLVGKRVVISNEVREGAHLEENLVKQLVGGDVVTARFLYQEHFEFRPKFKLMIAGNHQPVIKGDDDGIWRRVHLVPFVHTIPPKERDKELGAKLSRELPGILNWAIVGCLAWQKGGLDTPTIITEASRSYREEMDLLGAWIAQQCSTGARLKCSSRQLYENYRAWCESGGIKPVSSMVFVRKLDARGFRREHTRVGNIVVGIALSRGGLALVA